MRRSPFLIALTALAFGWITEAEAQNLSEEDLLRCEQLLGEIEPWAAETPEQQQCLTLLAQLGVQPAVNDFDLTDSTS